jgi:sulfur-carrier protein
VKIVYFAAVREAIGIDCEEHILPKHITSIAECLDWLTEQGGHYRSAFANRTKLRFALDQKMAKPDALLAGAGELAIFPPVTGG